MIVKKKKIKLKIKKKLQHSCSSPVSLRPWSSWLPLIAGDFLNYSWRETGWLHCRCHLWGQVCWYLQRCHALGLWQGDLWLWNNLCLLESLGVNSAWLCSSLVWYCWSVRVWANSSLITISAIFLSCLPYQFLLPVAWNYILYLFFFFLNVVSCIFNQNFPGSWKENQESAKTFIMPFLFRMALAFRPVSGPAHRKLCDPEMGDWKVLCTLVWIFNQIPVSCISSFYMFSFY